MTNILLAGGCSFTEEKGEKNYNFDKWPKILANKLKSNYVNLGRAGSSNQEISSTLFKYIVENYNNIKYVFVLWTDWYRVNFCFDKPGFSSVIFKEEKDAHTAEGRQISNDYKSLVNKRLSTNGQITSIDFVNYNLQFYKQIEIVCKYYKIPYFFMQGIDNVSDKLRFEKHSPLSNPLSNFDPESDILTRDISYKSLIDALQKNKLQIDTTRFIGWPPFPTGSRFLKNPNRRKLFLQRGFAINHYILKYNLMVSDTDLHPNKEGHKEIADIFFNEYYE